MSADHAPVFTPELLDEALTELGQLVHEAGRVADIAIYGGSCLMLVSNFRIATADEDAVAAEDQGFLDRAAETARFYPEARTSAKLVLAIDHLWSEYRRRLEGPTHEPPQCLGRARPQG